MASSKNAVRTRLVICIDGTWCEPDGARASGNQTNVYRTFASTKRGAVIDPITNLHWNQEAVYYPGLGTKYIGTATNMRVTKQILGGMFGKGYEQYLQDAYKRCCRLSEQDEVWLFGFSRGAFVVRALAGMLYHLRVIKSTGKQWDKDYKEALLKYETIRRTAYNGSSHLFLVDKTQPGPIIKFVGAFDTVKALDDHDLHDAAFNPGIQHMRHAVALHENRRDMRPDLENAKPVNLDHRSFIQAWFVGAHMDLGGSKSHDGLSLYPLQWMLEESRSNGLVLGFDDIDGRKQIMVNPLELVFPPGATCHTFETKNKIKTRMTDITTIHSMTEGLQERYKIKVNSEKSKIWRREQRPIFLSDGQLSHYFNDEAFGTIVHPSVYFLLFHHDPSLLVLDKQENALQSRLAQIERLMLGRTQDLRIDHGFWTQPDDLSNPDKTWPVRILICGKAGIGKSTLINKVFGVASIAKTSSRTRGEHEILEECKWEGRPDLIIHDSRGLEAASESEMKIVEDFLEESSSKRNPKDRLHVIWFCINANDHRPKETSTTKMFDAIMTYAPNIPVIVVATHTDVFEDSEYSGKQRSLMRQGRAISTELHDECVAFAKERLESRIKQLDTEMREVFGEQHEAQMVACVGTSQGELSPRSLRPPRRDRADNSDTENDETVKELTRHTVDCIDNEVIRQSCIAAQVTDIDIKVNAALKKVMAAYKSILWTSLGTGIVPTAAYLQRSALSIDACRKVFSCFGLPTVHVQTAYETLKRGIFDDMSGNLLVTFAEVSSTLGMLGSIVTFGASAVATGAVNAAILPPSNCRFYLIIACDLILILVRCFCEALLTKTGQPGNAELQRQCREYRFSGMPSEIYKQIKKIVPLHRIDECFRGDRVRKGIEDLVHENQEQIAISMSSHRQSVSSRNSSSDLSSLTAADSDLTLLAKEDVDILLD